MKVHYRVEIKTPQNHLVRVSMWLKKCGREKMAFFLSSWSPGSYLMREYARHIRRFCAMQENGEVLFHQQVAKGSFLVDFSRSDLKNPLDSFSIEYDIYCHELTVRTSHVDDSHAFLHGPSYLMGVEGVELAAPTIEFHFPPLWSKIATGLKDISKERGHFLYQAGNYDELLDTPVEIGCHESDGFLLGGKPHHLNFYGSLYPHGRKLKEDIKRIVETVSDAWGEVPYDQYVFITHFIPGFYGGLEHHNSTALHYDGTTLHHREKYLVWLELVAHEYFHTWNVKRIRPKELGPFDYCTENYTRMHWLTEGLTSFMDGLLVLRSGLMELNEYLDKIVRELNALAQVPGRKFHSLEDSSFNAWIKLYRPDENTQNSSVSYYLKGSLVFLALQCMLGKQGEDMTSFMALLWKRYKENPKEGMEAEEVYGMIQDIAGKEVRERFEIYIVTTEEIDFASHLSHIGLELQWEESKESKAHWGIVPRIEGERVFVEKVLLDGPAYKAGFNAGDEILFVNGIRFLNQQWSDFPRHARIGVFHQVLISRLGGLVKLQIMGEEAPRKIKHIQVRDKKLANDVLRGEGGRSV